MHARLHMKRIYISLPHPLGKVTRWKLLRTFLEEGKRESSKLVHFSFYSAPPLPLPLPSPPPSPLSDSTHLKNSLSYYTFSIHPPFFHHSSFTFYSSSILYSFLSAFSIQHFFHHKSFTLQYSVSIPLPHHFALFLQHSSFTLLNPVEPYYSSIHPSLFSFSNNLLFSLDLLHSLYFFSSL